MKTNKVKELLIEYNLNTGVAEISPDDVPYAKIIRACLVKRVNPKPDAKPRCAKREIVTISLLYSDELTSFDVTSNSESFQVDTGILMQILHVAKKEEKEVKDDAH